MKLYATWNLWLLSLSFAGFSGVASAATSDDDTARFRAARRAVRENS
jgi:hypothetical protein